MWGTGKLGLFQPKQGLKIWFWPMSHLMQIRGLTGPWPSLWPSSAWATELSWAKADDKQELDDQPCLHCVSHAPLHINYAEVLGVFASISKNKGRPVSNNGSLQTFKNSLVRKNSDLLQIPVKKTYIYIYIYIHIHMFVYLCVLTFPFQWVEKIVWKQENESSMAS